MSSLKLTKRDVDVSKCFLAFISFQGDLNRAALVLEMDPEDLKALAKQENWEEKTKHLAAMRESDTNLQINLNRAVNYLQARQLSGLIDGVIKELATKSSEELVDLLTTHTKNGSSFDTKAITNLVKAAELVQGMTCRALGDGGTQIAEEKENGASIGLNVANALNAAQSDLGVDAFTIVKKSLNPPKAD